MASTEIYAPVLAAYPADCQPVAVEDLGSAGGYSGAKFWRLTTSQGLLCLRRWPTEHPTVERLQFIQAVLWHVVREGFTLAPLPLEARDHGGFVRYDDALWELSPWMPGVADYHQAPSEAKLRAAMTALAEFHLAAESFPLPDNGPAVSPGMVERGERLASLQAGKVDQLARAIQPGTWPELADRATRLVQLFSYVAPRVVPLVDTAARLRVSIQPCIRDVWHDHVLFKNSAVGGLVDFGSMRPDNVATDVARLLGSLVADDRDGWRVGLAAYERVRHLSDDERRLVTAFDRTTVLMGGLQWLEWVYLERRAFGQRAAILTRLDQTLARLVALSESR